MFILLFFAFLAGIVTILSPCILPVLPLVLSGSVAGGKRRPWGIVTGFILSFTFFTLFLSLIVRATGLPPDTLRTLAIIIIGIFGISFLIPKFQAWLETAFSKLANAHPNPTGQSGFTSGFFMGLSLGLVWAPCVGPILASVIALALTGTVTGSTFAITLAYSVGTAIPMLFILYGGRNIVAKIKNPAAIQKIFGVAMIAVAVAMALNLDRTFQTWVLTAFPNYGTGLTQIETIPAVENALKSIQKNPVDKSAQGKPMFDVLQTSAANAPELVGGGKWFNSDPLTLASLKGKVVMVDFWTYTCINCIRTLPYTKAWYEKYKDKGFVLIGVHTPEFEFEKDATNVGKAIKDFGITYPVVQDNDYAIWNAYSNQYWPADYLIDKNGKIRDTHFGEGDYDKTEAIIVSLLNETGANLSAADIHNPTSVIHAQTPETYLGTARIGDISSPEPVVDGTTQRYSIPNPVPYNTFAFGGTWSESPDRAMPSGGPLGTAQLVYHFNATNVYLVMRPKTEGVAGRIQVLLDGKVVDSSNAGDDVVNGVVTVDTDRLYKLIKLPTMGEHLLELRFLDPNLELYAFTFG